MAITKLKLERMNQGIRQMRLAAEVGISQAELSQYELGYRRCSADKRYKLARILKVPVDVLFEGQTEEILE